MGNMEPTNSDSAGQNKTLCCFCPKSELDLKKNRDDTLYRKMFEDFLHNNIFQPRQVLEMKIICFSYEAIVLSLDMLTVEHTLSQEPPCLFPPWQIDLGMVFMCRLPDFQWH